MTTARFQGGIGFGAEQLGGHAWGSVDPEEAKRAVLRAVELGIVVFDTADCYGRGLSEERLGEVLRGHRHRVLLSTKGGVRLDEAGRVRYDNSASWIRQAAEASLRRLGVDRIDLYQLHHRDPSVPIEEAIGAFDDLQADGLIADWGVTNVTPEELDRIAGSRIRSVSWEYSLAVREHEFAIRRQMALGRWFLGYGSLGQGILSGHHRDRAGLAPDDRRHRPQLPNFHALLDVNLQIVAALRDVAAAKAGRSEASVALRYILERLPGAVALVGIKRPEHLDAVAFAMGDRLWPDELLLLETAGVRAPPADSACA